MEVQAAVVVEARVAFVGVFQEPEACVTFFGGRCSRRSFSGRPLAGNEHQALKQASGGTPMGATEELLRVHPQ